MSQSVSPQSVEELQHLVRTAAAAGSPIYTYRSGQSEGVMLDLSNLNQIFEIDAANLVAVVGPGVTLGILAARLAEQGLRFIPADTPFYQDKTMGRLFYEGCSNLSSLKYGSAKHFLMGSEIVLPDGELLTTGGKTVKNVTGYDFTRFFNAPYTDYGITVKFLLKLLPLPETRTGLAVAFNEVDEVLAFARDLKENGVVPAYLLWVDRNVQDFFQEPPQGQLVLLEFDGLQEESGEQCQNAAVLIQKHGGTIRERNEGRGQTASRWSALYRCADKYVLTDEYKMAFTRQAEFISLFYELAGRRGVKAGLFGQVAEGKLNLVFAGVQPEHAFIEELAAALIRAGGVLAGKYDRLTGKCRSGPLAELEQRAKAAFDPKQILNRPTLQEVK
ncbi:FAD-binding oxidoreductase [Sporomusa sphaeroides]|uniref:FAD-linked oxidoreductase n=1 Tax=Sporomusa sphaeroides DSM 2875 TaxID=1337886 RepID=A0ABP2C2C3_9FIRM|nr:FAD-binding oxidoreductase [Sporomusa sphaeroides]OLS56704.1 putative FAD-linked oxidoreductase [Sporomusa sphaeroides DSM 2875]CVK18651.1 putative FAD-linked oxidoreductase [Sporomusa sphaeroides DSM 2875]